MTCWSACDSIGDRMDFRQMTDFGTVADKPWKQALLHGQSLFPRNDWNLRMPTGALEKR